MGCCIMHVVLFVYLWGLRLPRPPNPFESGSGRSRSTKQSFPAGVSETIARFADLEKHWYNRYPISRGDSTVFWKEAKTMKLAPDIFLLPFSAAVSPRIRQSIVHTLGDAFHRLEEMYPISTLGSPKS